MVEKDFGEWVVPTSWDDITLAQLMELDALNESAPSLTKVVSVLTGKPLEVVEQLPLQFTNAILSQMEFIKERPDIAPSVSCVINGERFSVNVTEEMKLGEFVAVETVMSADKDDVAGVLAVVCRKDGESYTTEFENKRFEERKEMFLKASCMAVLPVVAFFLLRWELSENSFRRYSMLKQEALNLTQTCIDGLGSSTVGTGYLSRWRARRKLKRLKRHISTNF